MNTKCAITVVCALWSVLETSRVGDDAAKLEAHLRDRYIQIIQGLASPARYEVEVKDIIVRSNCALWGRLSARLNPSDEYDFADTDQLFTQIEELGRSQEADVPREKKPVDLGPKQLFSVVQGPNRLRIECLSNPAFPRTIRANGIEIAASTQQPRIEVRKPVDSVVCFDLAAVLSPIPCGLGWDAGLRAREWTRSELPTGDRRLTCSAPGSYSFTFQWNSTSLAPPTVCWFVTSDGVRIAGFYGYAMKDSLHLAKALRICDRGDWMELTHCEISGFDFVADDSAVYLEISAPRTIVDTLHGARRMLTAIDELDPEVRSLIHVVPPKPDGSLPATK